MSSTLDKLLDVLESEDASSSAYASAIAALEQLASAGSMEAAEAVAEVFAFSDQHHDAAKAYFWYHISLARQGYSTEYRNEHDDVDQYLGRIGDFRNEAQVNELLGELGEQRIRELDQEAAEWLGRNSAG